MRLSARNQLKGTITDIAEGAVSGVVSIDLGTTVIKSNITMESIKDLGLAKGVEATAVIKASNVMFSSGDEPIKSISARNQIVGTVIAVKEGAVNGHVTIKTTENVEIMGSITNEAIDSLHFTVGSPALAIIKSTDVIIGVE